MSEAKQLIQTLQWCPSAWDVVTLEIEGRVDGRMVYGPERLRMADKPSCFGNFLHLKPQFKQEHVDKPYKRFTKF